MRFQSIAKTARVVILNEEKILLCRQKGRPEHFLPGWELVNGEKAEDTIGNKTLEELKCLVDECRYIGAVRYEYRTLNGKAESGFELIFKIKLDKNANPQENELIEFVWKDTSFLAHEDFFPENLKSHLLAWLENEKVFLAT